jgi:hypothetical protein
MIPKRWHGLYGSQQERELIDESATKSPWIQNLFFVDGDSWTLNPIIQTKSLEFAVSHVCIANIYIYIYIYIYSYSYSYS